MLRKGLRWLRFHHKLTLALALLFAFLLLNLGAYRHAYAMTHFVEESAPTPRPEELSLLQKVQVLLTGVHRPRPMNHATPQSVGLPFKVHRFLSTQGIELEAFYLEHPDPQGLVVMSHSYASCKDELLREARAFHELGYAAFLVDFRGCGGSTGNETTIGVYEADDVDRAWKYVRSMWPGQPVILYGRSMGSAAILRAVAVHGTRPAAVVVECPFDRLASTVANRFAAMGLPAFPGTQLLVFWGGVQHGFDGFAHNPVDYARKVEMPVLLMHGEMDPRVTRAQAEAIFDNFPGTKNRREAFPETGHESCLASHPERWKKAVSEFLAATGGR
jgi:alpha-beta hydrolase superfamily lysophospholipase